MKRRAVYFRDRNEKDYLVIYVLSFILCAAIIADSVVYFLTQININGKGQKYEEPLLQALFIISLLSFLALFFAFMNLLRKSRAELRIQEVQYRILQSMSQVIEFAYDRDNDRLMFTYYTPDGVMERRIRKNYLKDKAFRGFVRDDYWEAYEAKLLQMLAEPKLYTAEFPMAFLGNGYCWFRLSCQSLEDERGHVVSIVGSAVDVDDLVVARDVARAEAATDAMTGLLGKSAFYARASERINNAKAAPPTLLMIDLDNFKEINDTFGHLEGDRLLSVIAMLLQRVFSADDLIGRFGGDEFVVFMQGISRENTEKKLMHFCRRLSEIQSESADGITCSIGAFCAGEGVKSVSEMIKKADEAMYIAKNSGKNNFCIIDGNL